jgi:hypothetical protein
MKHARKDYDRIQDPAGLIPEDEPVFLLRGQDMLAPTILRKWANMLMDNDGDTDMVERAYKQADKMEEWQRKHVSKLPDLPKK